MSWISRLFSPPAPRAVRAALAEGETDSTFYVGSRGESDGRDRLPPDRGEVLEQALEAWRINPLARRIVGLTSQYVVGAGVRIDCPHPPTARFLDEFWEHPLNRMAVRVTEWCDELTRSGNLFVLVSSDAAGMSYVRAVPANAIARIESRPNDGEQPLAFVPRPTADDLDPAPYPACAAPESSPQDGDIPAAAMLHYAVNRPVGAQWGESDLAPLLRWLARYAGWLEDRARLNRYRNAFLYVVKARFSSEAERLARQQRLNGTPPTPGSILVTDESESWDVIGPRLEAGEAASDGLALKKMIAAGAGLPLHFLAEPESATRTTAEAAGGPTYRHFEQRQAYFLWLLGDVLREVLRRRAQVDRHVSLRAPFTVRGSDISARDNVALGLAAANAAPVLAGLRDRGLIDDAELLRMVYRFAGEQPVVSDLLEAGRQAGPVRELGPDARVGAARARQVSE